MSSETTANVAPQPAREKATEPQARPYVVRAEVRVGVSWDEPADEELHDLEFVYRPWPNARLTQATNNAGEIRYYAKGRLDWPDDGEGAVERSFDCEAWARISREDFDLARQFYAGEVKLRVKLAGLLANVVPGFDRAECIGHPVDVSLYSLEEIPYMVPRVGETSLSWVYLGDEMEGDDFRRAGEASLELALQLARQKPTHEM